MDNHNINKKITILGAGVSGKALAFLAQRLGYRVLISDCKELDAEMRREFELSDIAWEDGGHTPLIYNAEMIVVGSGISPRTPELLEALTKGITVVGELDFVLPHLVGKIIAITGSNGKTTTTSLIGHLLASTGARVAVAGNIGKPLAGIAFEKWDYIVLELSSFQLHWTENLSVDIALVTNIAPDHIDWHGSFEAYVSAKTKLISTVKPEGTAIFQESDRYRFVSLPRKTFGLTWEETLPMKKECLYLRESKQCAEIRTDQGETVLFRFDETSLLGKHNMENAAMSLLTVSLCGYATNADSMKDALHSFNAPSHRCQLIADEGGVRYIDDSKGTNVASTVAALSSLSGKKVIILGGKGKGEDYSPLVPVLKKEARWAILMGAEKGALAEALSSGGFIHFTLVDGMDDAVKEANGRALEGDIILLSPACTSWDAYSNYKERGKHFQETVVNLLFSLKKRGV